MVHLDSLCCLHTYGSIFCSTYYERCFGQSKGNWGGRCVCLHVWPRNSFLIQPNGEMKRTLTDKAVTNQSHCESQRTVRDISGQSSYALVRRRPVTAHSYAAALTLRSRRNALCSLQIFDSVLSLYCCSSRPLSLWRLPSTRHAPSCLWRPDRGTQAALIGVDRGLCAAEASGVTAEPGWPVTKANAAANTHASTPNRTNPANMPKRPSRLALWKACPILSFSFCLALFNVFRCLPPFLIPFLFCYLPLWFTLPTPPLSSTGPPLTSQGWLLPENKLNHGRVMEHATFIVRQHTQTHTHT